MSQPSQLSLTRRQAGLSGGELPERGPRASGRGSPRSTTSGSAIMYLVSVLIAFLLGGIFAMALRLELLTPGPTIMGANTYNRMFTLHGVVMIFLFMIPAIPGVFGNFMLPLMLGAKDVAFPQLNLLSLYLYWTGAIAGARRDDHGRHRHRLDVLRALQHDDADDGVPGRCSASSSSASRRSSPASTSSSPSTRCARPAWAGCGCSCSSGPSTRPASSRCWRRRSSASPSCWSASRRSARFGLFDPSRGRRPGAVPAHVLVLLAPGRLHHGAAVDGRDQRRHRRLRAQEHLRLQDDRLLVAGHRLRRLLRLGPPHVRVGAVVASTTAPSRSSRCWSASSPPSRCSTGSARSTGAPSRSRRRSSTSAASSSSSCSAA